MLDRIVVISSDLGFGEAVVAALRSVGGMIDLHAALPGDAAASALYIVHGTIETPGPTILVLPRPQLAEILIDQMGRTDRVVGAVAADAGGLDGLAAMATRLLGADVVFGFDAMLDAGTQIHSVVISDYQEGSACMAQISALVDQIEAPRRQRAPIEQCVDEMVMNALFDAPVDEQGVHLFAEIPARTRITLRTDRSVVVKYGTDGRRFAVSVRDTFGSLRRDTVVRHLHKGLHAEDKISRKVGGAGVGLYLILRAATAVVFNVVPGAATEAICMFDFEESSLDQLGFFTPHAGVRSATVAEVGPVRRLPAKMQQRRALVRGAVAASAIALILVAAIVVVKVRHARQVPPPAIVELDSEPTDAAVEVDGVAMGATPISISSLKPGATVAIVFQRIGYKPVTAHLVVPAGGESTHHAEKLDASDDFVRVHVVSTPPGALILRDGQKETVDHTYTPAFVFVEAERAHRFRLSMPEHAPLELAPFTPARGTRIVETGGTLEPLP